MKQRIADLINSLYAFRNVIIWLVLFLVSVAFRLKGYVDGNQWTDLCKNTFLGLVAVHGSEHLISVVQQYYNAKNSQATAPTASDNVVNGDDNGH